MVEQEQKKIEFEKPKEKQVTEDTIRKAAGIETEDKSEEKHEEKVKDINYEEIAVSKGWKPKEAYDGPKGEWIGAEEFVKREPLFKKIKDLSKSFKESQKTIEAMANHFHRDKELAVKKAIDELKLQRKEAIKEGDVEKVEEIDKNIDTHKAEINNTQIPDKPNPVIIEWAKENKWFDTNMDMRIDAIAINQGYLAKHPNDIEGSLKDTDEKIRKLYPDKFKTTKKEQASPVETPSGHENGDKKYTINRLTEEQKLVYREYMRRKVMSHEDYFKSLEEQGYLS